MTSGGSLTIAGVTAITMDGRRPVVEDATIVVEEGAIVEVAQRGAGTPGALDGRGLIALPGLVNGHAHTLEIFLRGCGGQLPTLPWIRRTHHVMNLLDERGAYLSTRLATLEMLRAGTTAYLDPELPSDGRFDGMARAAVESGLRAGLSVTIEDQAGYHGWAMRDEPTLSDAERAILDRWHGSGDGRIAVWIGPSVLSAMSLELGAAIRAEAGARGLGIAFHLAEAAEDLTDSQERIGGGPVEFAERAGLVGGRTLVAHGIHLTEDEISRLAGAGASLVHCPTSNAKLGSGVAPVPAMLRLGLNVALGTDGGSNNDTYDLFAEMRFAGLIHRAVTRDPLSISAETVLEMATRNGAAALGLAGGRLEPGAPADIVLIDPTGLGFAPTSNPVDSLVYAGAHDSVDTVIVDGNVLLQRGRVVGVDEVALLREATEAARDVIERAGLTAEVQSGWFGRGVSPDR